MAEFPAMPLWTDAYLADTTHLTTIEHGTYLLLLMVAWRAPEKTLPDDDRLLARYAKLTPQQWRKMRPVMLEFWQVKDGRWIQKRLIDEANVVKRQRESARKAGKASALKRKGRHSTGVKRAFNGKPTPTPTPTPIEDTNVSSPPISPHENSQAEQADFLSPIPADAWEKFEQHRREMGKPLTKVGRKQTRAKLERLAADGHDPAAVIQQSIDQAWLGVFELKSHRTEKGSGWGWINEQ